MSFFLAQDVASIEPLFPPPIGNIAFYYGNQPPVAELQSFDKVVVETDASIESAKLSPHTQWMAYVSVGEAEPSRDYAKAIPPEWMIGTNDIWNSRVIDQAAPGWPAFFVKNVITPLWNRGFRGFFLDTLDSYQLVAKTPGAIARQQAGLVAVIRAVKQSYPEAELIFNRGFEIMPQVGSLASAVAFESLYRGWDQVNKRYAEVSEADRQWLLTQIKIVRDTYHRPVIAIDYCAPGDVVCSDDAVKKISALGITPYVSDNGLSSVGRGRIKVVPRRILVVENRENGTIVDNSAGVRFLSMPLNYMGYKVEFADAQKPLPSAVSSDIYAGIVVWANGSMDAAAPALTDWLRDRMKAGLRVAFMNGFGGSVDGPMGALLGLRRVPGSRQGSFKVTHHDAIMGFEVMPPVDAATIAAISAPNGSTSLLQLSSGTYTVDAAAITPWGGYVVAPYAVVPMDEIEQARWAIQPIEFMRRALNLTLLPAPDTTTENGTRLLMAHVDGDGFASRNEFPPGGFPGDSLYQQVWERYKIPTTLSIVEGEVGAAGLYPKLSPELETIAKRMFALPYVEVASHTFSHTFDWNEMVKHQRIIDGLAPGPLTENFHLPIPGYVYDTERELGGTINYINSRLTTPQKPVQMLLWPGSCTPPADVVRKAYAAGVLNLNGGDTLITKSNPSWTAIAPLGINKGEGAFQVYAPNQNEDLYTNQWTGPFYGFERVIETFRMTDAPYRFKPVDIYYHMYSGTKVAALRALQKVYGYALSLPNFPIYASEYARKVLDFESMSIAREGDDWIVHSTGALRTLRIPAGSAVQLERAAGVAGYAPGIAGTYVHLAGDVARFSIGADGGTGPYLSSANGRISALRRSAVELSFDLHSHVKPQVSLARASSCKTTVNAKLVRLVTKNGISQVEFPRGLLADNIQRIKVICGN